ncbi:MAG: hypothetical protein KJZ80_17650 [Hyphomicrobiaceae bacterium]|nr:hypothetical protein [Hyphomicrobiaceae bacterium]
MFVLTLGSGIDTEVARYTNAGELLEALFLETAAWLAIEQATRALVISLRDGAAARGLALTRRFAPGYADWALIEQKLLFSYLGTKGKAFPVELLDSGAMVPNMSRTGMYGLRRLI